MVRIADAPAWLSLAQSVGAPPQKHTVATFQCDSSLNVASVDGELLERLACDSSELLATGWQKVLHPDDRPTVQQLQRDLFGGKAGTYDIRCVGNNGHRLYLTERTFFLHKPEGTVVAGSFTLQMWETPRKHFTKALTALQVLIYASQVLPVLV